MKNQKKNKMVLDLKNGGKISEKELHTLYSVMGGLTVGVEKLRDVFYSIASHNQMEKKSKKKS